MHLEKVLSIVMLIGLIGFFNVTGDESASRLRELRWLGRWYIIAYDSEYSNSTWSDCPVQYLQKYWQERELPVPDNASAHVDDLELTWPYHNPILTKKASSQVILDDECYEWEMSDQNDNPKGRIYISRDPALLKRYPKLLAYKRVRFASCPPNSGTPQSRQTYYID